MYPSLCFWSFTSLTFVSSFTEVFAAFGTLIFFSKVKLSGKFQKNRNKNFQVKCEPEAPGADQGGPPLAQEARWRGPTPGRANKAPGAHRDPWLASLLPLSSFLPKNSCSCSGFAFCCS